MVDLGTLRHSASHILAQAVQELYPESKLGIGPAIADGFYYDFDRKIPFAPEDLARIEERMQEIVKAALPFRKSIVSGKEAGEIFSRLKEPYKLELLKEMGDDEVTIYRQGNFTDLCRGPHLAHTGELRAFQLLSVAGAYWRGSEKNPMLQRIYGTAFSEEAELEEYLHRLEEIKKRDHRRLGKELDLFSLEEDIGPGLVLWHPRGAMLRKIIEDFWREEHLKRGYQLVYTPHIAAENLWKRSGHLDYFRELMYPSLRMDERDYLLKPMNCPFHIKIYGQKIRSYRELPLRYAELGTVYRYERSGVLHGLLRVRGFTQDDAHIFCTPDQLPGEILDIIDLVQFMLKAFGYEKFQVELSVRQTEKKEDYLGDDAGWARAEAALAGALKKKGLPYRVREGEATFYGPKIDIKLMDALGRGWQGPTIQVDFNLPQRLQVTYAGDDGKKHAVMMIHRTVLGALERFVGGLIEHYAGAFPVWLAPLQVRVVAIGPEQRVYAGKVLKELQEKKLRADMDAGKETLNYKIGRAEREKIPYILIVGAREVKAGIISVRKRKGGPQEAMKVDNFIEEIEEEIKTKK